MKKSRLKTKPVDKMKELADIVKNSETDEIALEFLKEAWEDDFPDLELEKMNLHEAVDILTESQRENNTKKESELNSDLDFEFFSFMNRNKEKKRTRKRKRRR